MDGKSWALLFLALVLLLMLWGKDENAKVQVYSGGDCTTKPANWDSLSNVDKMAYVWCGSNQVLNQQEGKTK